MTSEETTKTCCFQFPSAPSRLDCAPLLKLLYHLNMWKYEVNSMEGIVLHRRLWLSFGCLFFFLHFCIWQSMQTHIWLFNRKGHWLEENLLHTKPPILVFSQSSDKVEVIGMTGLLGEGRQKRIQQSTSGRLLICQSEYPDIFPGLLHLLSSPSPTSEGLEIGIKSLTGFQFCYCQT